jgi:hypothetical protein
MHTQYSIFHYTLGHDHGHGHLIACKMFNMKKWKSVTKFQKH